MVKWPGPVDLVHSLRLSVKKQAKNREPCVSLNSVKYIMSMPDPTGETDLRRVILDSTRHLLVRDGYQSLSMRKIARAIGYSATSIYLHFENKDALIHALIEEGMDHLLAMLKSVEAEHVGDPVAHLGAMCRRFVDFGLENPEYYEIMFMLHPEFMERYPAEKYRRARRNLDVIAATLADGVAQGVFAVDNVRVAASTIWSALHGAVSLLLARRVDVRIERAAFIEAAIAQTLGGVLAPGVREATQPGPLL